MGIECPTRKEIKGEKKENGRKAAGAHIKRKPRNKIQLSLLPQDNYSSLFSINIL